MTSQLITIAAAAEQLSVSTKTIRRLISRGELPALKIGGHLVRVPAAALNTLGRPVTVPNR